MIRLIDWFLNKYTSKKGDFYVAGGCVFEHPSIDDGIYMNTSNIKSIRFESFENKLIMITKSDNEYVLSLSDIRLDCFKETQRFLNENNVWIPDFEECKSLVDKAENIVLSHLNEVLKERELYLKMADSCVIKAYWKNKKVRAIDILVHTGMFNDSYIVTDKEKHEVDFRYFARLFGIEPYHYSEGINAILIENIGSSDIGFTEKDFFLNCKSGEVTRIESKYFCEHGLKLELNNL